MLIDHSLDGLTERFEKLVLRRSEYHLLSDTDRKLIAEKFAHKSLQELQEIVSQLESPAFSYCAE